MAEVSEFNVLDRTFRMVPKRLITIDLLRQHPILVDTNRSRSLPLNLYEYESDEFLKYMEEIVKLLKERKYDEIPKMADIHPTCTLCTIQNRNTDMNIAYPVGIGETCLMCQFLREIDMFERKFKARTRKCPKCKQSRSLYEYGSWSQYREFSRHRHSVGCKDCNTESIVKKITILPKLVKVSRFGKLQCEKCQESKRFDKYLIVRTRWWYGFSYKPFCDMCILDGIVSTESVAASTKIYTNKRYPDDSYDLVKAENNTMFTVCSLCPTILDVFLPDTSFRICTECEVIILQKKIEINYTGCGAGHWRANSLKLQDCSECTFQEDVDDIFELLSVAHEEFDISSMQEYCTMLQKQLKIEDKRYI